MSQLENGLGKYNLFDNKRLFLLRKYEKFNFFKYFGYW